METTNIFKRRVYFLNLGIRKWNIASDSRADVCAFVGRINAQRYVERLIYDHYVTRSMLNNNSWNWKIISEGSLVSRES